MCLATFTTMSSQKSFRWLSQLLAILSHPIISTDILSTEGVCWYTWNWAPNHGLVFVAPEPLEALCPCENVLMLAATWRSDRPLIPIQRATKRYPGQNPLLRATLRTWWSHIWLQRRDNLIDSEDQVVFIFVRNTICRGRGPASTSPWGNSVSLPGRFSLNF